MRKREIKEIQKQINDSVSLLKRLEIRPCNGDKEIRQKELEIEDLKSHIHSLERECDRLAYNWWDKAQR